MKVCLKTRFFQKKLIRKNKSQNWLAEQLGITSGYMSQIMGGTRNPSPELRERIQELFPDNDFDELFIVKDLKK